MDFDVICVGNARLDIFLPIHSADQNFKQDGENLSFKLGDKFLTDGYQIHLGGIAANVAVGLSRLSKKVALAAQIGGDKLSETILQTLEKEEVSRDLIVQEQNQKTKLSAIVSYHREHVLFEAELNNEDKFDFKDKKSNWIYLTGLGKNWKKAYEDSLSYAKNTNSKIAFVPGIPQIQDGKDKIEDILESAEILFVNKDEACLMLDKNSDDIKLLINGLKELGPKIVVLTDGINGSYCLDNKMDFYHLNILETEAIETTGAGDAYSSGFLAATLEGKPIEEAMKWGAINSSSVVEKIGAQEGLLKKSELEERLIQIPDLS